MKRIFLPAVCLIYLSSPGLLLYGQEFQTYRSMEYGLITSESCEPGEKYPLVVCLHGGCPSGEARDKETKKPYKTPTFGLTDKVRSETPCFVIIPQAKKLWWDGGRGNSPIDEILSFIDRKLLREFPIDKNRLYIVGNSDGGTAILHLLAWYPDTFAAAIPLSGWLGENESTQKMVKSKTAVWWFAGKEDKIAPWNFTERVLTDYNRGKGNLKLTVIEVDGGHSAPGRVYKTLCDGTPAKGIRTITTGQQCDTVTANPIQWMFKQSLHPSR
ncbi:MAG: alpha/beta hydrolase-fold protein [Kiritimatiellales bacterium]